MVAYTAQKSVEANRVQSIDKKKVETKQYACKKQLESCVISSSMLSLDATPDVDLGIFGRDLMLQGNSMTLVSLWAAWKGPALFHPKTQVSVRPILRNNINKPIAVLGGGKQPTYETCKTS